MAKRGNIYYTDYQFTDTEAQEKFGFPSIIILHANGNIESICAYDESGNKSTFSTGGDLDKTLTKGNESSKNIILKSNFAGAQWTGTMSPSGISLSKSTDGVETDFVAFNPGLISFYKTNHNLVLSPENLTADRNIALPDKSGTVALTSDVNTKLDKPTSSGYYLVGKNPVTGAVEYSAVALSPNQIPKWLGNAFQPSKITEVNNKVGVNIAGEPTEQLEVGGNVKATFVKDQYGTLRSSRVITVTGNITLSDIHNGAILHIINTCNITIPTDLDANFNCVIYAKGAVIVTFVNSGVTINAPNGLVLKTDKMASLYANSSNTFNLIGELATS